jgi:hypothetical protein
MKVWPVVEVRFEASFSTFVLNVGEMASLWPEEGARSGISVIYTDCVEPIPL